MKIYFIRHAITECNLTGTMVEGYDNTDIIKFDNTDWENKVGIYIPKSAHKCIISSPAKRCIQTAEQLFNRVPDSIYKALNEYDCKALGNKKFWEISKAEFDDLAKITPEILADKAHKILETIRFVKNEYRTDECIAISHGMVIRYLHHYINGNRNISAYDVINSKGFKFSNLDLMIVDTNKMQTSVYNYKKPIEHKE